MSRKPQQVRLGQIGEDILDEARRQANLMTAYSASMTPTEQADYALLRRIDLTFLKEIKVVDFC